MEVMYSKERLKEIIEIAYKLGWVYPPNNTSYPLMQLSEVEKCMLAMLDNVAFERYKKWAEGLQGSAPKCGDGRIMEEVIEDPCPPCSKEMYCTINVFLCCEKRINHSSLEGDKK